MQGGPHTGASDNISKPLTDTLDAGLWLVIEPYRAAIPWFVRRRVAAGHD